MTADARFWAFVALPGLTLAGFVVLPVVVLAELLVLAPLKWIYEWTEGAVDRFVALYDYAERRARR